MGAITPHHGCRDEQGKADCQRPMEYIVAYKSAFPPEAVEMKPSLAFKSVFNVKAQPPHHHP